ncbi:MAG: hypothetical protein QM791_17640 [Ferruginibacter sp.]
MNTINQPTAEIKGPLSVKLANGLSLDDLCAEYIPGYNRDRFEAIALRVFSGNETVVTVYALDKIRQEDSSLDRNKIPVKKFKVPDIELSSLLSYCSAFNFTLSTGNYDIEDIEVKNK